MTWKGGEGPLVRIGPRWSTLVRKLHVRGGRAIIATKWFMDKEIFGRGITFKIIVGDEAVKRFSSQISLQKQQLRYEVKIRLNFFQCQPVHCQ